MSTDTVTAVETAPGGSASPYRPMILAAIPMAVVLATLLWLLLGWIAVPVGVVAGAAASWLLASRADDAVLGLAGGRVVGEAEAARLHNIVEGLSLSAGVSAPEIRVRDEDTVNAMAAGRAGGRSAVVVTEGLLRELDRMELEGVIAHLLVRLRRAEQEEQTVAVTTTGLIRYLRERRLGATGPGPVDPDVGTQFELDLEAVAITRFPPSLADALRKAVAAGTSIPGAGPASSRFWLAPVDGSTDDLEVRIAALHEL